MANEINKAMRRIEDARRKCIKAYSRNYVGRVFVAYKDHQYGITDNNPWAVGFQLSTGMVFATGTTLEMAIKNWLRLYQRRWDKGKSPYDEGVLDLS